jgi:hypothetical protein
MTLHEVTIHGYGTPEVPHWSVVHNGPLYYADTEAAAEHVAEALNTDARLLQDVIDVVNGNDYEHVKQQMIGVMVARRYAPFPAIRACSSCYLLAVACDGHRDDAPCSAWKGRD